jgi:hypothetical protein
VQEAGSADAPGLVAEAEATLAALEQALSAWRLAALLGGPYDVGGAVVSIQVPGPGLFAWWAVCWNEWLLLGARVLCEVPFWHGSAVFSDIRGLVCVHSANLSVAPESTHRYQCAPTACWQCSRPCLPVTVWRYTKSSPPAIKHKLENPVSDAFM